MSRVSGIIENRRPLLPVVFAHPDNAAKPGRISTFALADSGATCCCITALLAERLGVFPYREVPVRSAHGVYSSDVYIATLIIPGLDIVREEMEVFCVNFPPTSKCQAILGMDVLSPGQLTFHASGKFEFSV